MNSAIIVGRLVQDPVEAKNNNNEVFGYNMRVAVNEGKDKASFIPIFFCGQMTDKRRQKLVKGAGVAFTGELTQRKYSDKNQQSRSTVAVRSVMVETNVSGSLAAVTVVGNLTSEPETRVTANGHKVVNFSIAHHSGYFNKQKQEWVDNPDSFFDVEVWDETAINFIGKYFHKGSSIVVSGQLHSHNYTNKQNQPATSYSIHAEHVTFGFQKSDQNQNSNGNTQPAPQNNAPANTQTQKYSVDDYGIEDDDDLAF